MVNVDVSKYIRKRNFLSRLLIRRRKKNVNDGQKKIRQKPRREKKKESLFFFSSSPPPLFLDELFLSSLVNSITSFSVVLR
jgi:hypothetical protein